MRKRQCVVPVEVPGRPVGLAVPPSNHRYLNERLPHSKLDLVDVGHFTWEDAADQDAEIITGW
jgi:pimeloyl-ACP methyl ester carboxylesterase